jgi:hypothetical protein
LTPGSPEHVNIRLDSAQWVSTDADRVYFAKLIAEIATWERPGEKLSVVPIEEPFAWRRNYSLLEALKRRGHEKTAAEAAAALSTTAAAQSRLLNQFASDRQALLAYRDANRQQWATLAEYVGLLDNDLVEGERDARFGVEAGWQDKAQRIGYARSRLQGMSPSERADAHRIVEERRRLAILKAHDRDIDVLRAALGHVLQRLEAIESRLQKEVTSAAVA